MRDWASALQSVVFPVEDGPMIYSSVSGQCWSVISASGVGVLFGKWECQFLKYAVQVSEPRSGF